MFLSAITSPAEQVECLVETRGGRAVDRDSPTKAISSARERRPIGPSLPNRERLPQQMLRAGQLTEFPMTGRHAVKGMSDWLRRAAVDGEITSPLEGFERGGRVTRPSLPLSGLDERIECLPGFTFVDENIDLSEHSSDRAIDIFRHRSTRRFDLCEGRFDRVLARLIDVAIRERVIHVIVRLVIHVVAHDDSSARRTTIGANWLGARRGAKFGAAG